MSSEELSFPQLVEKAIYKNELQLAASFLQQNANLCRTHPHPIKRLFNELTKQDQKEEIKKCFLKLLNVGFIFDSKEYVYPLKAVIDLYSVQLCLRVLDQLIQNLVKVDAAVIQSLWKCAFQIIQENPNTSDDIWEKVESINSFILTDTSFYLPQEFFLFVFDRCMDIGRTKAAEGLLLDPRISVEHCPSIWKVYIERGVKNDQFMKVLTNLQILQQRCSADVFGEWYNMVIEKLIQTQGRCQISKIQQIVDFLIARKIELKQQNQTEVLVQFYHLRERNTFLDYCQQLQYTLDPSVFNFMLILIMEAFDFETAFALLELSFDGKLKKVDINNVDLSKPALKYLLKLQIQKNKNKSQSWDLLESDRSELSSVLGSPESKQRLKEFHDSFFPELKEQDLMSWFQVVPEPEEEKEGGGMVEMERSGESSYQEL